MRLIDADKLMKDIIGICKCQPSLEGRQKETVYIKDVIENQPTAFDVDKVVEQFESLKKIAEIMRNIDIEHNAYIEEAYERGRIYVLNEALDIVKVGGIDERGFDQSIFAPRHTRLIFKLRIYFNEADVVWVKISVFL